MTIFFLLDTSGSMAGAKIGALNDAMTNLLVELQGIDSTINISILLFSKNIKWICKEAKPLSKIEWGNVDANGMTSMGEACAELAKHLSENPTKETIFIIISDGYPTDDFDDGISELSQIASFQKGKKIAIAVDDADLNSLTRFTNDEKMVFQVQNINMLYEILYESLNTSMSQISRGGEAEADNPDDEWA